MLAPRPDSKLGLSTVFFQSCPMEPRFGRIGENQYRSNIFSYELPTPSRTRDRAIWNFAVPTGFLKKHRVLEAAKSSESEEAICLAVFYRIVLRAQKCVSLHFFCKIKFVFCSFSFPEFLSWLSHIFGPKWLRSSSLDWPLYLFGAWREGSVAWGELFQA